MICSPVTPLQNQYICVINLHELEHTLSDASVGRDKIYPLRVGNGGNCKPWDQKQKYIPRTTIQLQHLNISNLRTKGDQLIHS